MNLAHTALLAYHASFTMASVAAPLQSAWSYGILLLVALFAVVDPAAFALAPVVLAVAALLGVVAGFAISLLVDDVAVLSAFIPATYRNSEAALPSPREVMPTRIIGVFLLAGMARAAFALHIGLMPPFLEGVLLFLAGAAVMCGGEFCRCERHVVHAIALQVPAIIYRYSDGSAFCGAMLLCALIMTAYEIERRELVRYVELVTDPRLDRHFYGESIRHGTTLRWSVAIVAPLCCVWTAGLAVAQLEGDELHNGLLAVIAIAVTTLCVYAFYVRVWQFVRARSRFTAMK